MLPADSFVDPSALEALERAKISAREGDNHGAALAFAEIDLGRIDHLLLVDANARLGDGTATVHESSTREWGTTSFEVRARTGAGWRGAVVLDGNRQPWLVFADRHDKFHANAKNQSYESIRPSGLDQLLLKLEREREEGPALKVAVVTALVNALAASHASGVEERVEFVSPANAFSRLAFRIAVSHDEPAWRADEAHQSMSTMTLTVAASPRDSDLHHILLSCGIPYLQPDAEAREVRYMPNGELVVEMVVTHAKLAQLMDDSEVARASMPAAPTPPVRMHWLSAEDQTRGFVEGDVVRALCGAAFVPTYSNPDLPVCETCESIKPVAQGLLDQIRLVASNQS